MRVVAKAGDSTDTFGCDRIIDPEDGGLDVLIQIRPAGSADHVAIAPYAVPQGEILGRMSREVIIEAALSMGMR
jgi:hypothetical protein